MYLKPRAYIEINGVQLAIGSAIVRSSWSILTDTATVTLPRFYYYQKKDNDALDMRVVLKKGTRFDLYIGYDPEWNHEFSGYVVAWSSEGGMITLQGEDEAYNLKTGSITTSWKEATLKQVLQKILPSGYTVDAPDVKLGGFEIKNESPAYVLKRLSEQPYNLFSYFVPLTKTLHCGFPYELRTYNNYRMGLQDNVAGHSLEYQVIEPGDIKIKAVSYLRDGKKIEVEVPDKANADAAVRTMTTVNITSTDALKVFAQAHLKKIKLSGYQGSITAFGYPAARHGDVLHLFDNEYPERNNREKYIIDSTEVSFAPADYRRVYTLGSKL